jgi:hypothetical protein
MEFLKKLYANKTVYRLVWTTVQFGAGAVAVAFGANPVVGALVIALSVIITSEARERLGE